LSGRFVKEHPDWWKNRADYNIKFGENEKHDIVALPEREYKKTVRYT